MVTNAQAIKPDGLQRGLVGEVLSRFERKACLFSSGRCCVRRKQLTVEMFPPRRGGSWSGSRCSLPADSWWNATMRSTP
ncbi:unnamed protein product, partial [Ectocarpus sp. 12 AP-2014]